MENLEMATETHSEPTEETLDTQENLETEDTPELEESLETPADEQSEDDQPEDDGISEGFFGEIETTEYQIPPLDISNPETAERRWNEQWVGVFEKERKLDELEAEIQPLKSLVDAFNSSPYEAEKQLNEMIAAGRQRFGESFFKREDETWAFDSYESQAREKPISQDVLAALEAAGIEPEEVRRLVNERKTQAEHERIEQNLRRNFQSVKGRVAKDFPELSFTEQELIEAVRAIPELVNKPHMAVVLYKSGDIRKGVYKAVRGNKKIVQAPRSGTAKSVGQKPDTFEAVIKQPLRF